MKLHKGLAVGLISIALIVGYACQDQSLDSTSSESEQTVQSKMAESHSPFSAMHEQRNFLTSLKGENEVPEVETDAQGQAIFKLSRDGTSIHYKLITANIENVSMAHIHLAPAGENGPVVAWLYPAAPPPQLIEGRFQGVLAEGMITADGLAGPLEGQTMDDLLHEMREGNTYVNVHTTQHPAGEVRGQIR